MQQQKQFKIGDWVICHKTHLRRINKSNKLTITFSKNEVIPRNPEFYRHIELWQPKEGELIWVWQNGYVKGAELLPFHSFTTDTSHNICVRSFQGQSLWYYDYREHIIDTTHVTYKYSVQETCEAIQGIYELVLQANGDLTVDWAGKLKLQYKEQ